MSMELDYRNVLQNRGPRPAFLERYDRSASLAAISSKREYAAFGQDLLAYVSDERNLMTAADQIRLNGGNTPGPDGISIHNLSTPDLWDLIRGLRDSLRRNQYTRGPLRRCLVPKHLGSRAKRMVYVGNLRDRIVARAAAQILRPLLHPLIDPLSFCWNGRGTLKALACARRLTLESHRTTWIAEDMRNAFDCVPRQRLAQILRRYIPNDEFCDFIVRLTEPPVPQCRGILQGSPLSPMLLEVYLRHVLHLPWRKERLQPLIRYVDDVLVTLKPDEDARAVYDRLADGFGNSGMQPKYGREQAVVDLQKDSAEWLGYRIRFRSGELEFGSSLFEPPGSDESRATHTFIRDKFLRLHERPDGWREANGIVRGFVGHLAPAFPFIDSRRVYEQIAVAAAAAGYEEILGYETFVDDWEAAYFKWQAICAVARLGEVVASSAGA